MAPRTKYEDTVYEPFKYSGKIFIYCSPTWNVLFPVVDIIRLLEKNTIIGHVYGKGQQIIKTYGPQYKHNIMGYDLKTKKDYIDNLKSIKNIFIFSDESDTLATNLMNAAKTNKINVVCYSNLDTIYHFYNYDTNETISLKKPELVIEKMYFLRDLDSAKKYSDLFDDFEIIETPVIEKKSLLDECIEIMKKVEIKEKEKKVSTKIYDPHFAKLKRMEYERSQKNTIYPDSVENMAKKESKLLLSRFFKKK